jgi:hypothetical protein
MNQPMTNEQAKQIFNQVIATVQDPDRVARMEICREYLTNPDFRKGLEQFVREINDRVAVAARTNTP